MTETVFQGNLSKNKSFAGKLFFFSWLKKEQIAEILTYIFILLFTYAALRKLVDLKMYVKELWGFSLFGAKVAVKWELIILSCIELMVATLLTMKSTKQFGWYSAFILMVGINVATFYMQQFALIIPPLFGGILPSVSFIGHLVFNITMLFIALVGLLSYLESKRKLEII